MSGSPAYLPTLTHSDTGRRRPHPPWEEQLCQPPGLAAPPAAGTCRVFTLRTEFSQLGKQLLCVLAYSPQLNVPLVGEEGVAGACTRRGRLEPRPLPLKATAGSASLWVAYNHPSSPIKTAIAAPQELLAKRPVLSERRRAHHGSIPHGSVLQDSSLFFRLSFSPWRCNNLFSSTSETRSGQPAPNCV